jgi:uncharacterized protein
VALAIVDEGPLYAAVDADDQEHDACAALFMRADLRLVVPALVVAEVTYLVGRRLGSLIEAAFLAGLEELDVQAPSGGDWNRIAELVGRYANFPLGGTGASAIAFAERLQTDLVITLDRRHFANVRPKHCDRLRLLPEG